MAKNLGYLVCDNCGADVDFTLPVDVDDADRPCQDWCIECVQDMAAGDNSEIGLGVHVDREPVDHICARYE